MFAMKVENIVNLKVMEARRKCLHLAIIVITLFHAQLEITLNSIERIYG